MVNGRCGFCGYNIRNKIYKIKSIPTLPTRRRAEKTKNQHENLVAVRHYTLSNNPMLKKEEIYKTDNKEKFAAYMKKRSKNAGQNNENSVALWGMILGILAFVDIFIPLLFAPLLRLGGIVCSAIGLAFAVKHKKKLASAIVGTSFSCIAIFVAVVRTVAKIISALITIAIFLACLILLLSPVILTVFASIVEVFMQMM